MDINIVCYDYNGKEYSFNEQEYIDHESVYGAIIDSDTLLLVEHPTSKRWEFPGGGVEKGEDTFTALSREIKEETDLNISGEIVLVKSLIEYYYDLGAHEPWKSVRNFYTISHYSGKLRSDGNDDDVSRARFINRESLSEMNLTETTKEVARIVLE
jgi:8-oxo-dGTP pyrophosphatase MutT (NUDIX family)